MYNINRYQLLIIVLISRFNKNTPQNYLYLLIKNTFVVYLVLILLKLKILNLINCVFKSILPIYEIRQ